MTRGAAMISPERLNASRTDTCVPGLASPSSGGTQQARSRSNMAQMLSTSGSLPSGRSSALVHSCGALSMVNRRSWPTQNS